MNPIKRAFHDIREGENIDLYVTVLVALAVSVLSLLGWVKDTWLGPLTLAVLALMIASTLGVRRRLEDLKQQAEAGSREIAQAVIHALDGVEYEVFPNEAACLEYVTGRLGTLQFGLDDLSWSKEEKAYHPQTADWLQRYRQALAQATHSKTCRDIVVFNRPERRQVIAQRLGEGWSGYSCGYFPDEAAIPRLQFMVLDREEVVFFTDALSTNLRIKNKAIAGLFGEYYDLLWSQSVKLKLGSVVNREEAARLGLPLTDAARPVSQTPAG